MEKKNKKEEVGKVVSASNDKTITVLVETYKNHPLYHKRVKSSKKYCVHDEKISQRLEILFELLKLDHYRKPNISI